MLFDCAMIIGTLQQAKSLHDQDLQARAVMAQLMSPEDFQSTVNRIDERRELKLTEDEADRRHKETISAIRATSFWRFGF